jgi:methyl-accepting chemotaxis protein
MELNVQNITAILIGAGVVVMLVFMAVVWVYLRNFQKALEGLMQDTRVFSESARSLSLDIKSFSLSLSNFGQDVKGINSYSAALSQDIKTFSQSTDNLAAKIEGLTTSFNQLSESQNKMTTELDESQNKLTTEMTNLGQRQEDAVKSMEKIARHFSD